jgi:hypothetical protein
MTMPDREVSRLTLLYSTDAPAANEAVVAVQPDGTPGPALRSDANGVVEVPRGRAEHLRVLVGDKRDGPHAITFNANGDATLRLPPGVGRQVVLYGHLVDPQGQPARGVGLSVVSLAANRPATDESDDADNPGADLHIGDDSADAEAEDSGANGGTAALPVAVRPRRRRGVALRGSTLAVGVSDHNGAFALSVPPVPAGAAHPFVLAVEVNEKPITLALAGRPAGRWGPHQVVVERAAPASAHKQTHPLVTLDSAEIRDMQTADAKLIAQPKAARAADPCALRPSSDIPLRSFTLRQWGLVELPSQRGAAAGTPKVQGAVLIDFAQDWWDFGFSSGELLYSLPLGPCEHVRLAVLDWRRREWAQRDSTVDERHEQDATVTRNQNVDQTLNMTSDKSASSSASMWGGSVGGAINVGPLALGGSYGWGGQTQSADEHVEASTHASSRINDTITQKTNTMRNTRAFSLVEATQEEEVDATTRVVRNHNHCHTLTIQYFEVLHRYKISTRPVRAQPALAVQYDKLTFDESTLAAHGYALRLALLDTTLGPIFDTYLSPPARPQPAAATDTSGTSVGTIGPADGRMVTGFEVYAAFFPADDSTRISGWNGTQVVMNDTEVPFSIFAASPPGQLAYVGSYPLAAPVAMNTIHRIGLQGRIGRFEDVRISAELSDGTKVNLVSFPRADFEQGGRMVVNVQPPPAAAPPQPKLDLTRLLAHLNAYAWHYSGVLLASGDPVARLEQLVTCHGTAAPSGMPSSTVSLRSSATALCTSLPPPWMFRSR